MFHPAEKFCRLQVFHPYALLVHGKNEPPARDRVSAIVAVQQFAVTEVKTMAFSGMPKNRSKKSPAARIMSCLYKGNSRTEGPTTEQSKYLSLLPLDDHGDVAFVLTKEDFIR